MNQKITLVLLSLIYFTTTYAQTVIFEDDFESYTAGDRVAQASAMGWDTWSGTVGGAEDGLVSTGQASSGVNSMFISGTNDVLLRLDDQPMTAGRYKVQFKMYVNPNRYGYFNLLHSFDGANSSWATQSYFRPDGACNTDAGAGDVAQFTQETGEWFDMIFVVDLEDDFSTFYQADGELVSWKWSTGAFGAGTSPTFEALNFFAWNTEGTPGFYIDDIKIELVDRPGNELSLEAVLNGDNNVEVNWSGSDGVETYILTNRGDVLLNTLDTSAIVENPYPQLFDFKVGAHFNLNGYRFSDGEELNVAGGKARDFVLFEVGTGTWCVNCPAAARGVDDMHDDDNYQVGVIEYHEGGTDNYIIPAGTDRVNYYGINAFPTTMCDGELSVLGGSLNGNLFQNFAASYDQRQFRRSLYSIDMTLIDLGNREYRVEIDAEELYEYFDGPVNLRVALTESHIQETWFNLNELNFVLRDMYPDAQGTVLNFNSTTENYEFTFTLDPTYVLENCELVAFLQHDATQEILNGDVLTLEDAISATLNLEDIDVSLSPNPVHDQILIEGVEKGSASIYSQDGKLVHLFEINALSHSESLDNIPAGSYVVKIETEEGIASKQIIKK